ncbi:class I SAM-dependent methyltransferase [Clostridioides difficile]|uniref:class I SAM-dependent methyltransferase n=3 Tax=Clostridioides difficile TaxID=1496 RepID=UPI000939044B|nr:class I SAM-dependent methyltransferase [Clostridioides difficile]MDB3418572.1 class I SAM-dependent methyltransferase [Clostridioides difficile]MDB3517777.1 class I SAM-dependent methyltransferase [Clostridioides difficile]MDL0348557.1 class I SAM-dependent methyltransferase [Clostridioides difficile]
MLNKLCMYLERPELYKQSEINFWDDEYISKQLLKAHLDTNFEGASRNFNFIEDSVNWIVTVANPANYPKLLDLGCGPGLYAEKFAQKGYKVTGIDFSKRSINYAQNRNKETNLNINYLFQSYLNMNYNEEFDLATLIYCDYGALSTENRRLLMEKIYDSLKPGGKLILDVFTINKYNNFEEIKYWEINEDGGFWSNEKYMCLQDNCKYNDYNTLEQTLVITEKDENVFYVWNHYFSKASFLLEVENIGFKSVEFFSNVKGEAYSDDSMTMGLVLQK